MLFLDVDGVISLWGAGVADVSSGVWTQVDGVLHHLSGTSAGHLLEVTPLYECVWASGWEEKADEHLPRLLDLGPFGHLHLDGHARGAGTSVRAHWKLDAVEAYADGRPLAWVDDAVNDAVRAWAAAREAPTLLVETDPAVGVTAAHADALRAFAGG